MSTPKLKASLNLLTLGLLPLQGRVQTLYASLADNNSLCDEKLYQNMGYWKDNPQTMDEAGDALALLVAKTASMRSRDVVLDVGFGFADQDLLWYDKFKPKIIHGINFAYGQTQRAKERIRERNLSNRIVLQTGDACALPYSDNSMNVVVSVEAPFHFRFRDDFFKEAFRVLKPGGRLALADLTAYVNQPDFNTRMQQRFGRSLWQIPPENMYTRDVYRGRLEITGFRECVVDSIWQDTCSPFVEFATQKLRDPRVAKRMNPVFRNMLRASFKFRKSITQDLVDYVLVSAIKPK